MRDMEKLPCYVVVADDDGASLPPLRQASDSDLSRVGAASAMSAVASKKKLKAVRSAGALKDLDVQTPWCLDDNPAAAFFARTAPPTPTTLSDGVAVWTQSPPCFRRSPSAFQMLVEAALHASETDASSDDTTSQRGRGQVHMDVEAPPPAAADEVLPGYGAPTDVLCPVAEDEDMVMAAPPSHTHTGGADTRPPLQPASAADAMASALGQAVHLGAPPTAVM